MERRALLLASDLDRAQVADQLTVAATEGRLDSEELEERLSAAFSARTYGELALLVADLPAPTTVPQRHRRPRLGVWAGGTLAVGLLLSALAATGLEGEWRLREAAARSLAQAHGRTPDLVGHPGLIPVIAGPIVAIALMLALCAGLGWLFAQKSPPAGA